MFGVIFLLLIVVPLLELYVIVQVAGSIGTLWTIVSLLGISTVGAWLVRKEGTHVYGRIREQLFTGTMPSKEIADGALIMFGGTLLLTPGFVTDAVGLGLLIPPIRAVVRTVVLRRFANRPISVTTFGSSSGFGATGFGAGWGSPGEVIDVDVHRVDDDRAHGSPALPSDVSGDDA